MSELAQSRLAIRAQSAGRRRSPVDRLLLVMPVTVLTLVIVYPLIRMAVLSFEAPRALDHYREVFTDGVFLRSLVYTVLTCLLVTVLCLAIGFPIAYELTRPRNLMRSIVLGVVLVTLWISILVRTYSWILILQRTGAINSVLLDLGLIQEPLPLVRNLFGIVVGMVHVLLPYMVAALLPTLRAIDPRLVQAASSLGARRLRTLRTVVVPQAMSGIAAGCLLTFILGLAFFITPAILGGPSDIFVSQLIEREIYQFREFGRAAAMAVVLTITVVGLYLLLVRAMDPTRLLRGDS